MHPAEEIRGIKSSLLKDKRIVLSVTGSIAAVETVKLARELIRHGADVIPVMTENATKIIHPDSLWFATGHKPITRLTGETEHVSMCGKTRNSVDLLLICPSTANTISKISHGIDDTPVTTFATTALGSKIPVIIVPAMHGSMYDHKILQENIEKCKKNGIVFVEPTIDDNKAKMPSVEKIKAFAIRETSKKILKNKKILIIGGSTVEPVDDVRVLTNLSSGKTALSLVENSFYQGSEVDFWYGQSKEKPPEYVETKRFTNLDSLFDILDNNSVSDFDIIFVCAAISDFKPKKKTGKIPSNKETKIVLKPAFKFIKKLKDKTQDSILVAFKLEENKKELEKKAMDFIKQNQIDFLVGNTTTALNKDENEIWLYSKKDEIFYKKDKKTVIAGFLLEKISENC